MLRMQFSPYILILILAGIVIFIPGCTQESGPLVPATPAPVTIPDLYDFAINHSDLSACFSLTEQHVKSTSNVGQLALDLG